MLRDGIAFTETAFRNVGHLPSQDAGGNTEQHMLKQQTQMRRFLSPFDSLMPACGGRARLSC
jgi:hypothetical protein